MSDGYQGLRAKDRIGCLLTAIAGLLAFVFLDFGRVFGDPAPGTEDAWWREVPFFVPTLIVAATTFLVVRLVSKHGKSDGN